MTGQLPFSYPLSRNNTRRCMCALARVLQFKISSAHQTSFLRVCRGSKGYESCCAALHRRKAKTPPAPIARRASLGPWSGTLKVRLSSCTFVPPGVGQSERELSFVSEGLTFDKGKLLIRWRRRRHSKIKALASLELKSDLVPASGWAVALARTRIRCAGCSMILNDAYDITRTSTNSVSKSNVPATKPRSALNVAGMSWKNHITKACSI